MPRNMPGDYTGPIPTMTPETQPFWAAAKQHRLLVQRCRDCQRWYFYPRPLCPHCGSRAVVWEPVSGRARLHTFVINHRPPRNFPVAPPYVIGIVELEEGPRLMSHIVDVEPDPAKIHCDMLLEVVFEDITETITLPKFRPLSP